MRDFSNCRRIVVKIGTNVLTRNERLDSQFVEAVAADIASIRSAQRQLLVVTSGAIGMGAREIGVAPPIRQVSMRQACAAVGQPLLMNTYRSAFAAHGVSVAQVLLTREVLNNRRSYLNLRNAVETLLGIGVLPIMNENDSVSTAEIGSAFGDNDQLSALVASKVDADLLIMLSDIDALYTGDPRLNSEARPLRTVSALTDDVLSSAGGAGSSFATGGMRTKLKAVAIAERAGCRVVLAHGRENAVVARVLAGEEIGTLFLARDRLSNRERWILNSAPAGRVVVDAGAFAAIRRRNSLLPTGVVHVDGTFAAGAIVELAVADSSKVRARLITSLASGDLVSVMGRHSSQVASLLGPGRKEIVARPEEIVFID
ncbi:MAG: glutamate 5-kinase [Spirochaetaceae bacterium]|nr:MAG: glutamate 5-kinase [Spirochaetaceae bacterium]